ncbi:hypothetical protein [Escherichia phage P818]|nr:hypothetical protein [Escherichia phage P818]
MQVYTNSKGVEFCAIGDVVLRTGGGRGIINISGITRDQLVKGIQAGIFTFHSTLTADDYITLDAAVRVGFIE